MSTRFVFNPLSGNFDEISEITLGAVGSSPNANGATLSGQALNLEPADQTHPGVVTASLQTFGGIKNFTRQVAIGGTSDETQLSIQGNASQTNNILEIITSGFSYMMKLDSASKLSVYGAIGAQGIISGAAYFGPTAATALSGVYNLANTETIAFRNNLNSLDKSLWLSNANIFQMDAPLTSTGALTGTQLVSTVSTGTAPLSVSSTTQVANLYASRAALADTVTTNANLTGDVTSSGNATTYAGVVPEAKGGTAQSTYATGDTLYASASNVLSKRTIGSSGDVLTVAGGVPTWAPSSGFANPMNAVGDMIRGGTSGTPTTLAIGSTNYMLAVVGGIPAWISGTGLGTTPGVSQVTVTTPSGHGSGNTCIRKFSVVGTNTGSDITYTSNATNGDTFTINTTGLYSITYVDGASTLGNYYGISVNSNQLSTSIDTITTANFVMDIANVGVGDAYAVPLSITKQFTANDVIRAHTGGAGINGTDKRLQFNIVRVA